MELWMNESGEIIMNKLGELVLCEECPCDGFSCPNYLVGVATAGVDASGSINVDFSHIPVQAGDLICQWLVNWRSGATFLPLPSGWLFVTQINFEVIGNFLNLHHSFKVSDGTETDVTRTLSSGTADMASIVAVFRHPLGSFPVASGIFDGTYANGWYLKTYSSDPLSDPFLIHNNGPFLVQTVGEADMLHAFSWASGGAGLDLFDGQAWLTDPSAVVVGDTILGYATSPNFNAQLMAGFRCVPYSGEVADTALFTYPINADVGGVATYAGYQTAPPP
jgi:hypothetical protein